MNKIDYAMKVQAMRLAQLADDIAKSGRHGNAPDRASANRERRKRELEVDRLTDAMLQRERIQLTN